MYPHHHQQQQQQQQVNSGQQYPPYHHQYYGSPSANQQHSYPPPQHHPQPHHPQPHQQQLPQYGYHSSYPPQHPYPQYPPNPPSASPSVAEWAPSASEQTALDHWFLSVAQRGVIPGAAAVNLLQASQLPRDTLRSIWAAVDTANRGFIDKHQFLVTMRLVSLAQSGVYRSYPISMKLYYHTTNEKLPLPVLSGYSSAVVSTSSPHQHHSTHSTASNSSPAAVAVRTAAENPDEEWGDFAAPAITANVSISNLSDLTEATPLPDSMTQEANEEEDFGDFAQPAPAPPPAPAAAAAAAMSTPEKKKVDINSLLASITQDPLNIHSATLSQELQHVQSARSHDSTDHNRLMKSFSGDVSLGSGSAHGGVAAITAAAAAATNALDRMSALDELAERDLEAENEEWDDFADFTKPPDTAPAPPAAASVNPFDAFVTSATPPGATAHCGDYIAAATADVIPERHRLDSDDFGDFSSPGTEAQQECAQPSSHRLHVSSQDFSTGEAAAPQVGAAEDRPRLESDDFGDFNTGKAAAPQVGAAEDRPRLESDDFGDFNTGKAAAPQVVAAEDRPRLESDDFGDFSTGEAAAPQVVAAEDRPRLESDDFGDFNTGEAAAPQVVASVDRPRLESDDFGDFSTGEAAAPQVVASVDRPRLESDDFGDFAAGSGQPESTVDPWSEISFSAEKQCGVDDMILFDIKDESSTSLPISTLTQSAAAPPVIDDDDEFGDFEEGSASSAVPEVSLPPPHPATATICLSEPKSIQSATSVSNLSIASNDTDPFAELSAHEDIAMTAHPSPSNLFLHFDDHSIAGPAATADPVNARRPSVSYFAAPNVKPGDSKSLLQHVQQQRGLSKSPDMDEDDSQTSRNLPTPVEHRNLSSEELDAIVAVLLQLNLLPEAYRCLKQANAARRIKELNIKKMDAVDSDNLELAIQFRDDIAKLKETLASREEEMRWLRLASEGGCSESLSDIAGILRLIDESAGDLARVKYIDSHPQSTAGAVSESQLLYLIDARRRMQLAIAVRTSHAEYVTQWRQLLQTVKLCLKTSSQRISAFSQLSASDQAALSKEGKMNIFLRGLARIMEVGLWVAASCSEAMVEEELCNDVEALIATVQKQSSENMQLNHEYPLPSLEELARQAAELVGCTNVTYCNLSLRPVAVTVMKDSIGREKRVSGAAYAEYGGVPYMHAIICMWAQHFPQAQPPTDSIHFV